MEDRTLLELAAKAAGINLHVWGTPGRENFADKDAGGYGRLWNPLTDDGDALRLAVKLGLHIFCPDAEPVAVARFYPWGDAQRAAEDADSDPYAATRRAIVRAAAAMVKE